MFLRRLRDDKVIGWNLTNEEIDILVSTLPRGVYALESENGERIRLYTVTYRHS